jgi:hypothetical protein
MKTTTEIFESHLTKRLAGLTEEDITENYSPGAILLAGSGVFTGHEGIRRSASLLEEALGEDAVFFYDRTFVKGKFAFLGWSAQSGGKKVCDGADSFMIEDGKIVFQSVHYTVGPGNWAKSGFSGW